MTKTNSTTAAQEHNALAAKIDKQVAELGAALRRKLAEHAGQRIHYGHVGDLAGYSADLAKLLDQLNQTGEYAPENIAPTRYGF